MYFGAYITRLRKAMFFLSGCLGVYFLLVIEYFVSNRQFITHNREGVWISIILLWMLCIAFTISAPMVLKKLAEEIEVLRSTTDSKIAALEARIAELEKQK